MLFHEKVTQVMQALDCSISSLARASGLDASLISRFRSANRVPSRFSRQVQKLAYGLAFYANTTGQNDVLCAFCGVEAAGEAELLAWLNAADSSLRPPRLSSRETNEIQIGEFAARLSRLMAGFQISNVRLARTLNVDASLVSRFRSGLRTPAIDSPLIDQIAAYFASLSYGPEQCKLLNAITGTSFSADAAILQDNIKKWLIEVQAQSSQYTMDRLLGSMEDYKHGMPEKPSMPDSANLDGSSSSYKELEHAITHLLSLVTAQQESQHIFMYSELPNQYLFGVPFNSESVHNWIRLASMILEQGHEITVIHHMKRSSEEMLNLMQRWIPLYMTGRIKSYYTKKPAESRFSNTLVLAEGLAAVVSSTVVGAEALHTHFFITDSEDLRRLRGQMDVLLQSCSPLIETYTADRRVDYIALMKAFESADGALQDILPSLPFWTMPPALLEEILAASLLDNTEKGRVHRYLHSTRTRMDGFFKHNQATYYLCLPEDEALYAGQVSVNIPTLATGQMIYYQPEQYAAHLRTTLQIARENPQVQIRLIRGLPFPYIRLSDKEGQGVVCSKLSAPKTAFHISHPKMCEAFDQYFRFLYKTSQAVDFSDPDIYRQLARFLTE